MNLRAVSVAGAVGAIALVGGADHRTAESAGGVSVEAVTEAASGSAVAVRGPRSYPDQHAALTSVETVVFGTSAGGRPILAHHRKGSAVASRRILAVGVIHGDEQAGSSITDQLWATPLPADLDLWWVPTLNPDGVALGRAGNASGVDLNRNWPIDWAPPGGIQTSGKHHSGTGPASEPETQSMMALIDELEPDVTVWYHQPWGYVDCFDSTADGACAGYATKVGMVVDFRDRPGTATAWIRSTGHGESFVVELSPARLSAAEAALHAAALLGVSPG